MDGGQLVDDPRLTPLMTCIKKGYNECVKVILNVPQNNSEPASDSSESFRGFTDQHDAYEGTDLTMSAIEHASEDGKISQSKPKLSQCSDGDDGGDDGGTESLENTSNKLLNDDLFLSDCSDEDEEETYVTEVDQENELVNETTRSRRSLECDISFTPIDQHRDHCGNHNRPEPVKMKTTDVKVPEDTKDAPSDIVDFVCGARTSQKMTSATETCSSGGYRYQFTSAMETSSSGGSLPQFPDPVPVQRNNNRFKNNGKVKGSVFDRLGSVFNRLGGYES